MKSRELIRCCWIICLHEKENPPSRLGERIVLFDAAGGFGQLVDLFVQFYAGMCFDFPEVNPDMLKNLSVMVHPVGPDGEEYPPYHDAGIWAWSITAGAYETKKDAIDKWIEFFFEPENISIACAARPVYNLPLQKSVLESDVFYSDPITEMFKDEIEYLFEYALPTARRVGFEAGPSIVAGQISSQLFLSDAVQNYLFNNWI